MGILSQHTLLDTSSAGAGTSYPLDWRSTMSQERSVTVAKNTSDSVAIEVSVDNSSWVQAVNFATGSTSGAAVIAGPWKYIRANKTGTTATATVIGLL